MIIKCITDFEYIAEPFPYVLGFIADRDFGWAISIIPKKLLQKELKSSLRFLLEYQIWCDIATRNLKSIDKQSSTRRAIRVGKTFIPHMECMRMIENSVKTLFRVINVNMLSVDVTNHLTGCDDIIMSTFYTDIVQHQDRCAQLMDMHPDRLKLFLDDWLSVMDTLIAVMDKIYLRTALLIQQAA